jgi:hypothetical protein
MPDYDARWEKILTKGSFTGESVAIFGTDRYPVRVIEGKGYSRKEVDGRKVSEEPLGTFSLLIHKSAMPTEISRSNYALLKFEVDGVVYSVSSFWGYSVMRFVLKATAGSDVEDGQVFGSPDDLEFSNDNDLVEV